MRIIPFAHHLTMWKILLSALVLLYTVFRALPELCTSVTPMQNHNILFVTAHPDDEVMFFGPLLRHAIEAKRQNAVNILCLSSGNAEGLGETRVQELGYAAYLVGLPPNNVSVVDQPELPDSMTANWDPEDVAKYVGMYAREFGTSIFVTFDEEGVSGHPNHIAVSKGVKKYAEEAGVVGEELLVVELSTVSVFRKYLFVFDAIASRIIDLIHDRGTIFGSQVDYHKVRTAMTTAHKSQMTWFRYLYVSFSRYMIVNSFDYKLFPPRQDTEDDEYTDRILVQQDSADSAHSEL